MFQLERKNISCIGSITCGNIDFYQLGLYVERDYSIQYSVSKEIEVIYIPGRDMPYHKVKRRLPIEFEIPFKVLDSENFNLRLVKIERVVNHDLASQILIFNQEPSGFKVFRSEVTNVTRCHGADVITIKFICYPDKYEASGTKVG